MNIKTLEELKQAQKILEKNKERLAKKKLSWEVENKDLIDNIAMVNETIEGLKQELTIEGLKQYEKTNNKQLTGGLKIQVRNNITYEEEEAISWAETNMPAAIKTVLDKKVFEAFAKNSPLEFVKTETRTIVTFPKEITF